MPKLGVSTKTRRRHGSDTLAGLIYFVTGCSKLSLHQHNNQTSSKVKITYLAKGRELRSRALLRPKPNSAFCSRVLISLFNQITAVKGSVFGVLSHIRLNRCGCDCQNISIPSLNGTDHYFIIVTSSDWPYWPKGSIPN